MDVDNWMRTFAMQSLLLVGDAYTRGYQHNLRVYIRSTDQRTLVFPWDWDALGRSSPTSPLWGSSNLQKIIELAPNRRMFYGNMLDIITTTMNSAYLNTWGNHFGNLVGDNYSSCINGFTDRSNYVQTQLPTQRKHFVITDADFSVAADNADIHGQASIDVKDVYIQGRDDPLELSWTHSGSGTGQQFQWTATVPLEPGVNSLVFEAYDYQGYLITIDTITVTSTVSQRPLRDNLRVTELMYNPIDGSDYEYIELLNIGIVALDISNVFIADGVVFDFATSTVSSLAPGEYVVVVRNQAFFEARYGNGINIAGEFTSGKLNNAGERVQLRAAYSGYNTDIFDFSYNDSRGWSLAADGPGHSLVPVTGAIADQDLGTMDYGANWRASTYINGSPGQADPAPVTDIVINEIMAHTDYFTPPYDSNDWIELYNTTGSTVTLTAGDWYLSDDDNDLTKWPVPTTVIPAYGRVVFDEVTGFHNPITEGFGLNKFGEKVYLSYLPGDSSDRMADAVEFEGQTNSASLGRYPDGDNYLVHMAPTRDAANTTAIGNIVISEFMYNPLTGEAEYIELCNPTSSPIVLYDDTSTVNTGWRLDLDGSTIAYSFASGVTLPAYQCLLLVNFNPADAGLLAAFEADYGSTSGIQVFGPYSGLMDNHCEFLRLEKPLEPDNLGDPMDWVIVDEVIYLDLWPWPTEADGTGQSLTRIDTRVSGNNPWNWESADPSLGSHFVLTADFNTDGNINILDFSLFATAWLSNEGEPEFDRKYNLAEPVNTIIDVNDLVEFIKEWLNGANDLPVE